MKLALLVTGLATALLGCQHTQEAGSDHTAVTGAGALGKERSDCRADKSCDSGLLCLSNLCVRPPPADCQLLGDQLASMDLGNYAEPEERAPVVAKYKAQCETEYVSKEEGACMTKARDKWAAALCVGRLFPELAKPGTECAQVGDKTHAAAERMYRGNGAAYKMYIDAMGTAAKQACAEDKWSAELVKCVLNADPNQSVFSYGPCQQQMQQGDLMTKLQTRYQQLQQQAAAR